MSKGRKSRKSSPTRVLTPEQIAARERAIKAGGIVLLKREDILVRLIDTAIQLWFADEEYLSIHILASAAYRTLSDITSKSGSPPWLTAIIGHDELTRAYDDLRHASSDHAEVIEFVPDRNILLLAAAITVFEDVFNYRTPRMSVLMIRFILWLPARTFREAKALTELTAKYFPKDFKINEVSQLDRMEFFKKSMPFFEVADPRGRLTGGLPWRLHSH